MDFNQCQAAKPSCRLASVRTLHYVAAQHGINHVAAQHGINHGHAAASGAYVTESRRKMSHSKGAPTCLHAPAGLFLQQRNKRLNNAKKLVIHT